MLALGHAVAGSIAEAQAAYAEASALVAAMSDEELSARVDAAAYLCSAATYLDRYDEAVAHAERALRLGRAAGHLHPTLLPALGAAHFMRGRLDEAAKVLDDGVEAARLAGITQSMAWMLRNRALLSVVAGDLPAALEMAEEALELTRRLDESVLSSWAAMAVARASVMAGRSQRAVDVLEAATTALLRRSPARGARWASRPWRRPTRTSAAATRRRGRRRPPRRTRPPWASRWPSPGPQRAAAAVALHAGEPATAAERALASAAAAEEVGAVIEAALSRMLAGRALAAAGEQDRAAAEIERAAATFEACGALPHRDAAEQELRRLGRARPPPHAAGRADGDGLAALTERELQVAALVVDRKTNPEIAAELFLSLEDRRDAPAQHLPQARRVLARRARARRRARAPGRLSTGTRSDRIHARAVSRAARDAHRASPRIVRYGVCSNATPPSAKASPAPRSTTRRIPAGPSSSSAAACSRSAGAAPRSAIASGPQVNLGERVRRTGSPARPPAPPAWPQACPSG